MKTIYKFHPQYLRKVAKSRMSDLSRAQGLILVWNPGGSFLFWPWLLFGRFPVDPLGGLWGTNHIINGRRA